LKTRKHQYNRNDRSPQVAVSPVGGNGKGGRAQGRAGRLFFVS
jgi:hypothetical protein